MVNHRHISAVESRWRVQLAYLGEIKQHLNHFHYCIDHRLKVLLSPNIFVSSGTLSLLTMTKCCEVVTTQFIIIIIAIIIIIIGQGIISRHFF